MNIDCRDFESISDLQNFVRLTGLTEHDVINVETHCKGVTRYYRLWFWRNIGE